MISANFLFYFFGSLLCVSTLCSILSKNSVHAVLYLVLSFFAAAWVFLILNAEFLAMLLIIVYVGAIAVLFLFVVMMLQTNYKHQPSIRQTSIAILISSLIFLQISTFVLVKVYNQSPPLPITMAEISNVLYIENFFNLQLVSLILLIAMVSVILLTLQKSSTFINRQSIAEQVLRRKEDCIEMTNPEIGKGIKL